MPVSELPGLPTEQLLQQLTSGDLTSEQLVKACLQNIEADNESINAFVHVNSEAAVQQAIEIDRRRAAGEAIGALQGLPVGIKDNMCEKGIATTCGSRMLNNFQPPYDADVVERIRAADGIIIGKLNMDEFAMGSSTETSYHGITRNPRNPEHTPGGSSGGSAAAVAAKMVPLALGSDTGGSIRQPAAFCGVVGMKPTYGRVSRYGLVAFASSLDQIGPLSNDVFGSSLLMNVIAGHDVRDTTSMDVAADDYVQALTSKAEGLTIGVVDEHFGEGLDVEVKQSVQAVIEKLKAAGAKVKSVAMPHAKYSVATYYLIAPSEASSNLARYDGIHYGHRTGEGFGAEVKRRIMLGTFALSEGYSDQYYLKALKVRRKIREDYDAALQDVDVIIGPVAPTTAFRLGEKLDDPLAMYLNDIYTISANLAGIPGMSVPCGEDSNGLPIGIQLQAGIFEEAKLLQVAKMIEQL
ncbi:UNVERIFIED_CONTAM: hypothetical protein GTU68_006637 [Idotea baltica]|nr:hypothetical protein [Idotea baltica]